MKTTNPSWDLLEVDLGHLSFQHQKFDNILVKISIYDSREAINAGMSPGFIGSFKIKLTDLIKIDGSLQLHGIFNKGKQNGKIMVTKAMLLSNDS
mmetsp:Transcript_28804/g.58980  ORF Transcript_28804/g.58980 Transcript_28804/m.58980 type:complete len:95 (-) Transcript_28804:33-317(-)